MKPTLHFQRPERPFALAALSLLLALCLPPTVRGAEAAIEPAKADVEEAGQAIEQTVRGAVQEAQKMVTQASRMGKAVAYGLTSGSRPTTLVIPKAGTESGAVDGLNEDLSVMGRILEKAAGRPDADPVGYFSGLGFPPRRSLQGLYLDGFGALFLVNVDFPLVAPKKVKHAKEAEPADSTWEETRRELREGRAAGGEKRLAWIGRRFEGGPEFDAARVEELKQALIEALKHAANLKAVRAEESVAVSVFGPAPRDSAGRVGTTRQVQRYDDVAGGGAVVRDVEVNLDAGEAAERGTSVLTLRVRKADIDAFAKGSLSADDFGKKVSVSVR